MYGLDTMISALNSSSGYVSASHSRYDHACILTREYGFFLKIGLSATVPWEIVYGYDARYQLTSETYYINTNFYLEMQYSYDPAGNRTKLVTTNPNTSNSPVTTTSSYYADNQIEQSVQSGPQQATVTTNYGEDKNGNLTSANSSSTGLTTYSYDFENRLKVVDLPAGTTVQFGYNPDGLRVQKTGTTGVVTDYVLDGLQVLLEKNASGVTQTRYVPALATIVSGAPSYYLEDRMGSILGLANSSQSVTDTFVYDAWGNIEQRNGNLQSDYEWLGSVSYIMNGDTMLYLLGLRFYDSIKMRFITRDPLNFYIKTNNKNAYEYMANNPLKGSDPIGLDENFRCVDGNYCESQYKSCLESANLIGHACLFACMSAAAIGLATCTAAGPAAVLCYALIFAAQASCEAACILNGRAADKTCYREYQACLHDMGK